VFDLTDVMIAVLLVIFLMLWWNAQGVKQIALQAACSYCKKIDVQLLDETVVLRGFWLKRNARGHLCLWRSYDFEFTSTGDERYTGKVVLLGRAVEDIHLDPHRLN
jgi:hypothetical protein